MNIKIKENAIELFFKKGYEGTSVRDITNSLNITPAALYAHFSSKADLFLQIFEEGWEAVRRGAEKVIEDGEHSVSREGLYSMYKYYISFYNIENSRTIFLLRSVMFPPDELRDKVISIFQNKTYKISEKLEVIFLKLINENSIRDIPVKEHIRLFYRLVDSFIFEITALNMKVDLIELDKQWERYWLSIVK